MQEFKAMWPHQKVVITMKTHEATWLHHMLVFLNKAQGLLKNKNELFNVLHAPNYKVINSSKNLNFFENLSIIVPINKLNKMNFNTHKKL
jgi:hypothetical protein